MSNRVSAGWDRDVPSGTATNARSSSQNARYESSGPDSTSEQSSDSNDELLCPLCGDLYFAAVTLNHCGHSFCSVCIRKHVHTALTQRITNKRPECAICRTPFKMSSNRTSLDAWKPNIGLQRRAFQARLRCQQQKHQQPAAASLERQNVVRPAELPKVSFKMMKRKQLNQLLESVQLSCSGSEKQCRERYTAYAMYVQANHDELIEPRTANELRKMATKNEEAVSRLEFNSLVNSSAKVSATRYGSMFSPGQWKTLIDEAAEKERKNEESSDALSSPYWLCCNVHWMSKTERPLFWSYWRSKRGFYEPELPPQQQSRPNLRQLLKKYVDSSDKAELLRMCGPLSATSQCEAKSAACATPAAMPSVLSSPPVSPPPVPKAATAFVQMKNPYTSRAPNKRKKQLSQVTLTPPSLSPPHACRTDTMASVEVVSPSKTDRPFSSVAIRPSATARGENSGTSPVSGQGKKRKYPGGGNSSSSNGDGDIPIDRHVSSNGQPTALLHPLSKCTQYGMHSRTSTDPKNSVPHIIDACDLTVDTAGPKRTTKKVIKPARKSAFSWSCTVCTFHHMYARPNCAMCGSPSSQ